MTAITMAAVLATYGSALALEHVAHLHLDIVIDAIIIARGTARVQRRSDLTDRIAGFAVLAVVAVVASEISRLMSTRPVIGDSLFVLGIFASTWVRRFGARAAKAGALMTAPFIAALILHTQGPQLGDLADPLWAAPVALIAYSWVFVFQVLAARAGFCEQPRRVPRPRAAQAPSAPPRRRRLSTNTRMALQTAVSLSAAFIIGRIFWPSYWIWVVLTAFIVCSGARARGDVVFKGLLRAAGAMIGTVIGLLIADQIADSFGPRSDASVVLIFIVLAVATWLRERSYAYWAGGITTVLSLLYGWFGEPAGHLLPIRLECIVAGAIVGIAASCLVLPVRTRDVLRRRSAEALAALGGVLSDNWQNPTTLEQRQRTFNYRAHRLEQIARPLRAHRRLLSWLHPDRGHRADAIDAIQRFGQPMGVVVRAVEESDTPKADPGIALLADAVAANVTAVRRAIARKPGAPYQSTATLELPAGKEAPENPDGTDLAQNELIAALGEIDSALGDLAEIYSASPPRGKASIQ
jgi:Fusaric acid resistance protein family